jgi:hypothetical protein
MYAVKNYIKILLKNKEELTTGFLCSKLILKIRRRMKEARQNPAYIV